MTTIKYPVVVRTLMNKITSTDSKAESLTKLNKNSKVNADVVPYMIVNVFFLGKFVTNWPITKDVMLSMIPIRRLLVPKL